jgi:hypothetical protein
VLCSVCKLIGFRFSALAHLVPSHLMSHFFLHLGLAALGLSCLITSTSALAAQVILAWEGGHDTNVAGYIVYYGYASGQNEGSVDVSMQTTSALLDLEEGQAYYFVVASYNGNGEESELSSEIIFHGPQEDSAGERDTDDGVEADEADDADETDADAESPDDVEGPATDWQHLEADDADERENVNEGEEHPKSELDTDSAEVRTDPTAGW